jgi:hypothetical protein
MAFPHSITAVVILFIYYASDTATASAIPRDVTLQRETRVETCVESSPHTASSKVEKNAGVSLYVTTRTEVLPGLDTEISTDRLRETAAMQVASLPEFASLKSATATSFKPTAS